jgi:two-component system response regulator HydG
MKARVLVVDDDKSMGEVVAARLGRRDYGVKAVTSGDEAIRTLTGESFDVVVTDLKMKGMSGIQLCEWVVQNRPDSPVLVITAFGSLDTAIAAIRAGAYDFITKPFDIDALVIAIDRAVQHRVLREEVKRLRKVVEETRGYGDLIGQSPTMETLRTLLARVASSASSVLITGESGTGKEVVARLLHKQGPRADGPFVALNCAAMPESLLESELFGHVKGAFTDAKQSHDGLLVQADKGTLFLDEIGDMPLGLQPKLLRALEDRKVRPVGGQGEVAFEARIVAATNHDLEDAVAQQRFRSDLYFRLNVIQIELPPLRARGSDVLLLAQHFLNQFAREAKKPVMGLTSGAAEKLLAYAWPGNVRELRNCIERAVTLTQHEQVTVDDLPERVRQYRSSHVILDANDPTEFVPMSEVERRYIHRVIEAVAGNKTLAARILGFDRTTLYRKLEQYKLEQQAKPGPG